MDTIKVDLTLNEDGVWTDESPKKERRFDRIKDKFASAKEAVGNFIERNQEGLESGLVGSIVGFGMTAASILGLGAGLAIIAALGGSESDHSEEDSSEGGIEE